MRVFDAFAGIGGFSLGLELAGGFTTAGVCEIDPFCRAVLRNRFPHAWQHDDITTLTGDQVRAACGPIDVLTGGVPCQPASVAGSRKGIDDERWLWPAFLRLLRELRPVWVLAENVPGFVSLKPCGLDWLHRELDAAGYESLALLVGADDVGAPHRRKRVWIVAHRDGQQRGTRPESFHERRGERTRNQPQGHGCPSGLAHPNSRGRTECIGHGTSESDGGPSAAAPPYAGDVAAMANAAGGCGIRWGEIARRREDRGIAPGWPGYPGMPQFEWERPRIVKFSVDASVNGIPGKLARFANRHALRGTGNAVVPQIVTILGAAILDASE